MASDADQSIGGFLSEGRSLLEQYEPVEAHQAFGYWVNNIADWLDGKFSEPALSAHWSSLRNSPLVTESGYHDDPLAWSFFRKAVRERLKWLATALEHRKMSDETRRKTPQSRKVFVVHGRDEAALQGVARFLEKLGLGAIILREEPDAGRTIIEKFEECAADVGFAVILLTADDVGGVASATATASRARQNVIFELGYFAGKLGRGRTCLMQKGAVEIPSDLHGVIYTNFDQAEGWKVKLVRELKAAKLDFDANQLWR